MQRIWRLGIVVVLPLAGLVFTLPTPVGAAGVVGDGTAASCTDDPAVVEAELEAALADGGLVEFDCGPDPVTIVVTSEKLIVADTEIDGGGLVTLDGQGITRLFFIDGTIPNTSLTLRDIALTGGHVEDATGGAIYNDGGTLIISGSMLSGNSATGTAGAGGAIFNEQGTLTISDTTLSGNESVGDAGAIFSNAGTLTISGSTLEGNEAGDEGGAIFTNGGGPVIIDSTLSGNHAGNVAGAIMTNGGTLAISSSRLSDNQAEFAGGAIFTNGGTLTISSSTLSGNQSGRDAGAIFNGSGTLTISGSTLIGNSATGEFSNGGAIFNSFGTLAISGSTLIENSAMGTFGSGGAIYNFDGTLAISASTLSGNSATGGTGGAIYSDDGTLSISGSTLSGNRVTGSLSSGGAIYGNSSPLKIANSTLSDNQADFVGGAIITYGGRLTINSSTLSGNQAVDAAIHSNAATVILGTTIVASSDSGAASCAVGDSGVFFSLGYNLSTDDSCNLDPSLGDLPNTDPQLTALADNGGPTFTHLPLPTSPVIDHIPATACATDGEGAILPDQRGVARPQNGRCDIGSVEIVPYLLCADHATGEIREARGSGCGRREQEISLELDGPHTVCISQATGRLRLASPNDECTRTEQVIILPDDGPITVCVHHSTGDLRVPSNDICTRYEDRLMIGGSPPAA